MTPISAKETLTCEFKSDRQCLSDRDLIEAVVCMASSEGGDIYLGVEDDGRATGLHDQHRNLDGLVALIANRTQPSVAVRVSSLAISECTVARIEVSKSGMPVATNDGVLKRRRLQANGRPEQMVRNYVAQHGRITRQEVIELCRLTPDQAYKLLRRLADESILEKQGDRKGAYYIEQQDIRPGV